MSRRDRAAVRGAILRGAAAQAGAAVAATVVIDVQLLLRLARGSFGAVKAAGSQQAAVPGCAKSANCFRYRRTAQIDLELTFMTSLANGRVVSEAGIRMGLLRMLIPG